MSNEQELMGKRGEEMGGIFSLVPQAEALMADIKKVVDAIDPNKIRDLLDAITVDGNTITIDLKMILRKTP